MVNQTLVSGQVEATDDNHSLRSHEPTMHQFVRARPLGGQQLQRLRELREAGDNEVRERHLRSSTGVSASLLGVVEPPASRTVDAIVQERLRHRDGVSTPARLRDRVAASRRGMQTERSERPASKEGALRPVEKPKTTRKIAAVRRRGATEEEKSDGRRRMGREEAEWVEKQLQYGARATTLEKECHAAWQSFFAGAGASIAASPPSGFVSAADVNKMVGELEAARDKEVQKMRHELRKVSSKANDVQAKVEEIANGDEFLSELQEKVDAMETALAKLRLIQSEQLEEFVLEEKVLEKELEAFMEKISRWENEVPPRLARGGASTAPLGPKLSHLGSKSTLATQRDAISRRNSSNNDEEKVESGDSNQGRAVRIGTPDEIGMVNRVRRLNDAILRSGGLKGGWDSREHATFTTLLVKCGLTDDILLHHLLPDARETQRDRASNQEPHQEEQAQDNRQSDFETRVARFLRKCMRKVVTQTESAVRSHFEWYLRYLELVEEKRRAIHDWKVRKEEERQQIIQCGFEANGEGHESIERGGTPDDNANSLPRVLNNKTTTKSREKTERLLEQWKQEKRQKEEEREQRRRERQKRREAIEAKVSAMGECPRAMLAVSFC